MARPRKKSRKGTLSKRAVRVKGVPQAHDFVDRSLLPPTFAGVCNLPRVCAYLAELNKWLQGDFYNDYKRLRIAVCNVERKAFATGGAVNAKPPKFCTGGGGSEPAAPPKPPDWD